MGQEIVQLYHRSPVSVAGDMTGLSFLTIVTRGRAWLGSKVPPSGDTCARKSASRRLEGIENFGSISRLG